MAKQPWLRLYTAILENHKIQTLPDRSFRLVINLWCLTKEYGGWLPPVRTCAFRLRMTTAAFEKRFTDVAFLFERSKDGRWRPHDWEEHQYEAQEKSNLRVAAYRERLAESGSSPAEFQKLRPIILERDRGQCVYCLSPENLVIDHVVPLILGGWTAEDNLVTACRACNAGKVGRIPEEAGYAVTAAHAQVIVNAAVTNWRDRNRDSEHDKERDTRGRADARSESVSGSESESGSSGENNGKPKERLPPRNPSMRTQVTDPQWFEFMAKWKKTGGIEASVRDWDEALSVWKTIDFEERLEASMGLDRDHVGKENCLPQNYLGKRIYRRGLRKTATNSRSDELRRVLEAREAQRS